MEVHDKLAQVRAQVEHARAVPMSASAMVNRGEVLRLLDELDALLPSALAEADKLLAERSEVLAEARAQAEAMLTAARRRQDELLNEHELVLAATAESERLVGEARAQAQEIRHDAEDYADERLANIELVLDRLLTAVKGGRDHLAHLAEAHEAHSAQWRAGEEEPTADLPPDLPPPRPAPDGDGAPRAPGGPAGGPAGVDGLGRREPVEYPGPSTS